MRKHPDKRQSKGNTQPILKNVGLPTSAHQATERVKAISGSNTVGANFSTEAYKVKESQSQGFIPIGENEMARAEATPITQPFLATQDSITESIKTQVLLDSRERIFFMHQEISKEFSSLKDKISDDYQNTIINKYGELKNEIYNKFQEHKHSLLLWGIGTFVGALLAIMAVLIPYYFTSVNAINNSIDSKIKKALEPINKEIVIQKKKEEVGEKALYKKK